MASTLSLELWVEPAQQGQYLRLPFEMPPGVESLALRYEYARHRERAAAAGSAAFTTREEINIIDLGLIAPDGSQVGASGSDKTEIFVSATTATAGYHPHSLGPGRWEILVGAYKVAPEGVSVRYTLAFTPKQPRWLRGDLHTHTIASDGVLTAEELAWRARRHGLDFLAITDHNQPVAAASLPHVPGLTVISGLEWTHYQGHANFLGCDSPYAGPFATNTFDETLARFRSARERGALITVNHPFEEACPFSLDLQRLPFDCLEVWNGPMRESNLKAIGLWQSLLAAGRKVPICGGSDYHRDTPFIFLGGPTTCVFAESASPADILAALRAGHAYLTFAPNGPWLELGAGGALMGDTASWPAARELELRAGGLLAGDVVRVVTRTSSDVVVQAPADGQVCATVPIAAPGFARVEVLRAFIPVPGFPKLPALLSNPIYFEG
jgi:hypothetical protein